MAATVGPRRSRMSAAPRRTAKISQHIGLLSSFIVVAATAFCWKGSETFLPSRCVYGAVRSTLRSTVVFSSTDAPDSGGDNESINDPERLQDALGDLFRIAKKTSHAQKNQDPSVAYSVPNLDCFRADTTSLAEGDKRIDESVESDENNNNVEGMFLTEDVYLQSRDMLNPDGSLNPIPVEDSSSQSQALSFQYDAEYQKLTEQILIQHPELPTSFLSQSTSSTTTTSTTDDDGPPPTLESLLQYKLPDPDATSEEMHRKVFENEQGYLNQSEVFRQSLGTTDGDGRAAAEAARLRRGADYRRRQDEVISKLEQEIANFEANLGKELDLTTTSSHAAEQTTPTAAPPKCFKCGCGMSEEELKYSKQKPLCSLCYADILVAKSDKSFTRDPPSMVPKAATRRMPRHGRSQQKQQANEYRRARPPARSSMMRPPPIRERQSQRSLAWSDRGRTSESETRDPSPGDTDDSNFGKAPQDDSKDNHADYSTARDPWVRVEDPDTPGEFFYWNQETEEMRWEL